MSAERFWSLVDRSGGPEACWEWQHTLGWTGYGHISIDSKLWMAHRYSVVLSGRELPEGMAVDHLCRNRACVNPDHLEVVTPWENTRRGNSFSAINAAKTHCVHGHEFTPGNTIVRSNGWRACRACQRVSAAKYRAKIRAARRAA